MFMCHHEAGQLAELVLNSIKGNERRRQRRCLMSKDERTEELKRRRWRKRMLNGFVENELILFERRNYIMNYTIND